MNTFKGLPNPSATRSKYPRTTSHRTGPSKRAKKSRSPSRPRTRCPTTFTRPSFPHARGTPLASPLRHQAYVGGRVKANPLSSKYPTSITPS